MLIENAFAEAASASEEDTQKKAWLVLNEYTGAWGPVWKGERRHARVDQFVAMHGLNDYAAACLHRLCPSIQFEVLRDLPQKISEARCREGRGTLPKNVAAMIESYGEESPFMTAFEACVRLSSSFARLIRLQPRQLQDEVLRAEFSMAVVAAGGGEVRICKLLKARSRLHNVATNPDISNQLLGAITSIYFQFPLPLSFHSP